MQSVWFWLVMYGAVSLVLLSTACCSLVGLVRLAWYCLVQSVWPVWFGFDLLGTASCSQFGLFGLI